MKNSIIIILTLIAAYLFFWKKDKSKDRTALNQTRPGSTQTPINPEGTNTTTPGTAPVIAANTAPATSTPIVTSQTPPAAIVTTPPAAAKVSTADIQAARDAAAAEQAQLQQQENDRLAAQQALLDIQARIDEATRKQQEIDAATLAAEKEAAARLKAINDAKAAATAADAVTIQTAPAPAAMTDATNPVLIQLGAILEAKNSTLLRVTDATINASIRTLYDSIEGLYRLAAKYTAWGGDSNTYQAGLLIKQADQFQRQVDLMIAQFDSMAATKNYTASGGLFL